MNTFIFDSHNVGLQSQAELDASLGRIQPAGHLLFITNTDKILHFVQKKSSMKPVFIHCWWLLTWYFMIFSQNVDIKPSICDGRLNEPHMVMVGGRFWRWFGKYRRKNSDCKWAVMCRKMRWYYQFHAVLMNPRSVACSSAVADTGPLQHSGLIVKK